MNRNVESHFATSPQVNIKRSIMNRPFRHKTSFNVGQLIPHYLTEVIPGSTIRVNTHKVIRTQPMVSAPLDDLYVDTYYFFVPMRLIWNHWKEFCGENTSAPWVQTTEYTIPQLEAVGSGGKYAMPLPGSLCDYFGLPTAKVTDGSYTEDNMMSISALPFRAYALICREFFQDENLETPINVKLDDTARKIPRLINTASNYVDYLDCGGFPYVVNRYHDYFSSCLPGPVKSDKDILAFPDMPVIPGDPDNLDKYNEAFGTHFIPGYNPEQGAAFANNFDPVAMYIANSSDRTFTLSKDMKTWYTSQASSSGGNYEGIPYLAAISDVTINDLRTAFQIQRLLERDAYGGTRYREMLRAHFGVTSPDASMQVPQYLGGKRQMLNINQVLQTSESGSTPQANVAGYSLTADSNYDFEQSFSEHGYVIGLTCVRYKSSYQQGINRMWSRKTRFEFYYPELANLGNMAVMKKELDFRADPDDVFGYQEAWADYRYHPDIVSGEMRSGLSNTLDSWHFADFYENAPTLSRSWMAVSPNNVDRVLAVSHSVSNQLFADFSIDEKATLPMPLYSIPGLIDHN